MYNSSFICWKLSASNSEKLSVHSGAETKHYQRSVPESEVKPSNPFRFLGEHWQSKNATASRVQTKLEGHNLKRKARNRLNSSEGNKTGWSQWPKDVYQNRKKERRMGEKRPTSISTPTQQVVGFSKEDQSSSVWPRKSLGLSRNIKLVRLRK